MHSIRPMTGDDVAVGMRLKRQAGWNQLESDWRRLLALQPDGCFVAELDGLPVGTVTTCRFGPVAWVAMMLVDAEHRGRGIGRALMTRALEDLDRHGVRSVRLDATPLGQPLYETLGFAPESTFARFQGKLPRAEHASDAELPSSPDALDAVRALDRAVTGTDRGQLLGALVHEHADSLRYVEHSGSLAGYVLSRPGSSARQIGPCIIADEAAGPLLLADAARRYAGQLVFIDVPASNKPATDLAFSLGLTVARTLTRMGRGPRVDEDLTRLWASAGPEKG